MVLDDHLKCSPILKPAFCNCLNSNEPIAFFGLNCRMVKAILVCHWLATICSTIRMSTFISLIYVIVVSDIALAEVEKEKKMSFIKAWEDSEKSKAENK